MGIMLGNVNVEELEKRLNIKLTEEDRNFLYKTRQNAVCDIDIKANKWHCFDIPFVIKCGSKEFATEIYNRLSKYEVSGIELGIVW